MYRVTKRFARGAEAQIAEFRQEEEAKIFIHEKLQEDANFKINAVYCLYEGSDLHQEFTQSDLAAKPSSSETTSGESSRGQRFSPTPMNTVPRPPGIPRSGFKDEEDDKEK